MTTPQGPPRPTRPGPLPRTAAALVLALCALAVPAAGRADGIAGLVARARGGVVRIDVRRPPGANPAGNAGTAVLIDLDPKTRQATFVTAYHVLYTGVSFSLTDADGRDVAYVPGRVTCHVDRSRELAFLRVVLKPRAGGLEWKPIPPPEPPPPGATDAVVQEAKLPPQGVVFGYAEEDRTRLQPFHVDLLYEATAPQLKLLRNDVDFEPRGDEIDPNRMLFRMLGGRPTSPGVSGGACLDTAGGLAGVVFGRRTDRYNLFIPGFHVRAAWDAAKDRWKPFAPGLFLGDVLYGDDPTVAIDDRREWGTLDGLKALLGDDPARELEQFQEIRVTPRLTGKDAPPLRIYVSPETVPSAAHNLRLWHDGVEVKWNRSTGVAEVEVADKPGESLLTVIKTSGRVNDFELGGLVVPSTVDLSFSQGDAQKPFHRVVRALPVIAQTYALFFTIRMPTAADRPPPPPRSGVRLAVRLDYLQALLNRVPFEISVRDGAEDHRDEARSSEFHGAFRLGDGDGWRFQTASEQRVDVYLKGNARLYKARYRDASISPTPGPGEPADAPKAFVVKGLLQFPRVMPDVAPKDAGAGLGLSVRAIGTSGTGSFRINVGKKNDLTFDLGGILRHLFTIYINKRLIATDQPHLVNEGLVRPFFTELGLDGPEGTRPRVLRVGFLHEDGPQPKDWVVAICDFGGQGATPPGTAVGLGPVPSSKDGLVFELRAGGVPGGLVKRFPNLPATDPHTSALLNAAKVSRLRVGLKLPGEPDRWFPPRPAAKAVPVLNEHGVAEVARQLLAAFRASTNPCNVVIEGAQ